MQGGRDTSFFLGGTPLVPLGIGPGRLRQASELRLVGSPAPPPCSACPAPGAAAAHVDACAGAGRAARGSAAQDRTPLAVLVPGAGLRA